MATHTPLVMLSKSFTHHDVDIFQESISHLLPQYMYFFLSPFLLLLKKRVSCVEQSSLSLEVAITPVMLPEAWGKKKNHFNKSSVSIGSNSYIICLFLCGLYSTLALALYTRGEYKYKHFFFLNGWIYTFLSLWMLPIISTNFHTVCVQQNI